jgi:cytidylate kinase
VTPLFDHRVVAIDGPAASGKSSVALRIAKKLGWLYVNTGAMYRAVTWCVLKHQVSPADGAAVLALLESRQISWGIRGSESTISIDGVDPTPWLRDDDVNANVSQVSAIASVRDILVAAQRDYLVLADLVMEGRDIGSVVFPETPYKFYIDASPGVRARRRALQGPRDEIGARDRSDSSRRASPLIIADDAHIIDSSNLTIDGVAGEIIGLLKLRGLEIDD